MRNKYILKTLILTLPGTDAMPTEEHTIGTEHVLDLESCANLCTKDQQCLSFVWEHINSGCTLKNCAVGENGCAQDVPVIDSGLYSKMQQQKGTLPVWGSLLRTSVVNGVRNGFHDCGSQKT